MERNIYFKIMFPTLSHKEINSTSYVRYVAGILAIIFLALIIMAVLIGRYMARHKGEYLTQEDKGADGVFDPDQAVVNAVTGHQVRKKKEWFI
jgi:contactin associated protein-like 2